MIQNNETRAAIRTQMAELLAQAKVINESYSALHAQLNEPLPWLEETNFRLVLSDAAIMKIWLQNEALVNAIRQSPDIKAEKDDTTTYVYLNYIYPEDEALIVSCGGNIELKTVEFPEQEPEVTE